MFKLTLKVIALAILFTGIFTFFSGGTHAYAASNCPGAPYYSTWGNRGGDGLGLMASMMIYARGESYNPINTNYTLNTSFNGNAFQDQKIFQWPVGSAGRASQKTFATGEHIYGDGGWDCNGWSVLGPGINGHDGNGWVVDCGDAFTQTKVWISHIDNPGGAAGKWELIYQGRTISNDVNNSRTQDVPFPVNNGGNVQIQLIWHPDGPTGTIKASCFQDDIVVSNVDNRSSSNPQSTVLLRGSGGSYPARFPVRGGYFGQSSYSIAVPDWVKERTGGQDVIVELWVVDSTGDEQGPIAKATIDEPWSQCHQPPQDTCHEVPWFQNPKISNLDKGSLPDSGNFNPNGSAPSGSDGHKYSYEYHISDVRDQYNMQATNWTGKGTNNNQDNPFWIWYNDYVNQYPYDSHDVTVYYKVFQTDDHYRANGTYHPNSNTKDWTLVNHSVNSFDMSKRAQAWPECEHRGFQVLPLGASARLGDTQENPSNVTFGFSVPLKFFLPAGDTRLRNPAKICGLTYSASYYIQNATGANVGALPGHPSDSGGVPGGCIDTSGPSNPRNWTTSAYGFPPGTLRAGDKICVNFAVAPPGDRMDENGNAINPLPGDVRFVTCSAPMVNEPYFKVYNSGVSAGGDFDTCSTTGGILAGWNDNRGANRGAGTQLNALALANIKAFASAQNSGSPSPTGLTFANNAGSSGISVPITTDVDSPSLGGNFGGSLCLTNETAPSNAASDIAGSATVGAGPLTDGAHKSSGGNLTLNGGTVGTGRDVGVYVDGHDVYISATGGGIKYSSGPWSVTATTSNVPSFVLAVSGGNIYIDPNVTELAGIYIASKDRSGNGGKIYTCASSNGTVFSPVSSVNLYNTCNQQLTIYGSFVANQINLMRAYGSLRDATAGEQPSGGGHSCNYSGGTSNKAVCAGEVFRFSPEIYLTTPAVNPPSNGALQYQAITSLPPVL